jgi:hypothetical protein
LLSADEDDAGGGIGGTIGFGMGLSTTGGETAAGSEVGTSESEGGFAARTTGISSASSFVRARARISDNVLAPLEQPHPDSETTIGTSNRQHDERITFPLPMTRTPP